MLYKSQMSAIVEKSGGMMGESKISFLHQGQEKSLSVGQSWEANRLASYDSSTYEIIGFAAPKARGRIASWDDDAEVPSVVLRYENGPQEHYQIVSAWDCSLQAKNI